MSEKVSLFTGLMGTSWDDIENLPDFANPVNGNYLMQVSKAEVRIDEENDKASIGIICALVETVETDVPLETPYPEGTLVSFRYFGDFGIKKFKKDFNQVREALGASTPEELLDMLEGTTVMGTLRQRPDRDDPSKVYSEIVTLVAV